MRKIRAFCVTFTLAVLLAGGAWAEDQSSANLGRDLVQPVARSSGPSLWSKLANGTKSLVNSTVSGTKKIIAMPSKMVTAAIKKK